MKGNCLTTMIATFNAEGNKIDESISTARFAQRVAMIKNEAVVNEEQDPKILIKQLKAQIDELKEEIASLKGEKVFEAPLTDVEKERCKELVTAFAFNGEDELLSLANQTKIKHCFHVFKSFLDKDSEESGGNTKSAKVSSSEVTKLKLMLQARDNEIGILVSMLQNPQGDYSEQLAKARAGKAGALGTLSNSTSPRKPAFASSQSLPQGPPTPTLASTDYSMAELTDRNKAFEDFRSSYRKNQVIEEQKETLKLKYADAKQLGESINQIRTSINRLKSEIGHRRLKRGAAEVAEGGEGLELPPDDEERRLMAQIEDDKARYKDQFQRLKEQKTEIETLQHLLEKSRRRLQADFESWFAQQQQQQQQQGPLSARNHDRGKTDRTSFLPQTPDLSKNPIERGHARPGSDPVVFPALRPTSSSRSKPSDVQLLHTGDPQADADIAAFYKMRDNVLKQQRQSHGST